MKKMKYTVKLKKGCITGLAVLSIMAVAGCGSISITGENNSIGDAIDTGNSAESQITDSGSENVQSVSDAEKTEKEEESKKVNYSRLFNEIKRNESYKGLLYNNPLISQDFGADPYAMVYNDTLYIYMTQDRFEKESSGEIKENSYSKIKSIRVISTKDMVNWTDHGEVHVAYSAVGANWARNSWAPAVAWKNVDGKDQFFLYFADGGGGIGVLQADSPVGPFNDPIGHGLITRNTPNCADVLWLFDPAVLVDDDGRAYIYFGGGVPSDKISHPMTARVVELGDDMISIKGEPVTIDAPYLFEDSGIHKFNNKYYYTYCSNWQVDAAGTAEYGFTNAEIVCMESDSPMGPFTIKEVILDNPGKKFGLYGNNHHCVFSFRDEWYITYHTRVLEQKMGVEKGYRCTFINKINMKEDGSMGRIIQSLDGCSQIAYIDPYETVNACTFSHQAGLEVAPANIDTKKYGSGTMKLTGIDTGDFLRVKGVDFSYKEPEKIVLNVRKTKELDENCAIEVRQNSFRGDILCHVPVGELLKDKDTSGEFDFVEISVELKVKPDGVHDIYMIFSGEGYEILDWKFAGTENNWYDEMIETSLISTGTNGRLEKVMQKLQNGEEVNVAFIGGSVTEGAGAAKITESYADQVVQKLKKNYPSAKINYVNAGLGGTPSALGIMRYQRDVVDKMGAAPDLLFVEFSVNDYQEATNGRAFESLVRTALEADEDTAVCLVFAVFKSKWNMQDLYIPVGNLYGLPMVSIKDATKKPFENGKITDEKFFSDDYHPTSYGHTIMSDCVANMLAEAGKKEVKDIAAVPSKTAIGNDFQGSLLVTSAEINGCVVNAGGFASKDTQVHAFMRTGQNAFPDNWKHVKGEKADEFVLETECKTLLINYKQSSSQDAGAVLVYVDGKLVKELNSYNAGGWNQSIADLIIDEKTASKHTVTIRMKDADKEFSILAFAYSK